MKVSAILFVVACFAVALSVALPVEPVVTSEVRHAHLAPVEEAVAKESGAADQHLPRRARRSPRWHPKKFLKKVKHQLEQAAVPIAVGVLTKG